ncbi:MAG: flagellar hook-associated protein FlgK [Pseudomonadota bacterium]
MTIALDAAISGLRVAQQALDVVSSNISNASTPGYTRKILPQENLVINGVSVGARTNAVTRSVDAALIADLNRQVSVAGGYDVRRKYLDRIQTFHGSSDSGQALSACITALSNTFAQLSLSPDDQNLLSRVVSAATQTTQKINDFSNLLTDLRIQSETEIMAAVADVNQSLDIIARLNVEIQRNSGSGRSTAELEDQRDEAVKTVAKYLQISTFSQDNQIIVITKQGRTLADNTAYHLYFQSSTMLPSSYYPGGGLTGLTVDGPAGENITQSNLGGQLGALFDLRDTTLPQYTAQLDEFSQKLAERFQNEGLKLFTDLSGNVPASVPDPGIVGYVGFSALIKVNDAIVADPTLIRNGTTGNTEPAGSNEVIRRVAQFAFGSCQYQQAAGTVDISAGALTALLGLTTNNRVTGTTNLAAYSPDISTLPGAAFPGDFDITLGTLPTQTITVLATDTAATLVAKINAAFGFTTASVNGLGQVAFNYGGDITLADNTIGAPTMTALGFSFGATPQPEPSFQVQVGTRPPVTVSIAPAGTAVELLAALNAIPGLTASLNALGQLVMIPTDGGDLKATDASGTPLSAMGVSFSNVAPTAFRQNNLGPDGSLSTGLLANSTLGDYISGLIATQSEDASLNQNNQNLENSYLQTLETRNANISGVNIDQEMSDLIRIQSAYAAAAKMISATQKLFDDLLNAFR